MRAPDRTERIDAADRCSIELRVHNPSAGATVVLSGGVGCGELLFRHLVDDLAVDHRVVTWDLRGQGGSTMPTGAGALTLGAHAGDLATVQAAVGAPVAAHLGFGLGASVALEHLRRHPGAVRALVLVQGGAPGLLRGADRVRRSTLAGLAALGPLAARAARAARLVEPACSAAARLGLVAPCCDREDLAAFVLGLAWQDPAEHLEVAGGLVGGIPEAWLPTIDRPVLVLAATLDPLCPEPEMRRLHETIAASEYERLEGASRACLLELGPVVAARVRRFLDERLRGEPGQGPTKAMKPSKIAPASPSR